MYGEKFTKIISSFTQYAIFYIKEGNYNTKICWEVCNILVKTILIRGYKIYS